MTAVYFFRHGEIENPDDVIPFRADGYPLSKTGTEHVGRATRALGKEKIEAIFASPILRCRQTAEILAENLRGAVQIDERLTEVGSPFTEIADEKFLEMLADGSLYRIPKQLRKGESAEEIVGRMRSFLDEMLGKYANKSVLAVSHGDPIMLLWCSVVGKDPYSLRGDWPEYIPRAGCYQFVFEGQKFVSQKLVTIL